MNIIEKVVGIDQVKVVKIEEGDFLFVKIKEGLSAESYHNACHAVVEIITEMRPDLKDKILVACAIDDIQVVRKEQEECQSKAKSMNWFQGLIQKIR